MTQVMQIEPTAPDVPVITPAFDTVFKLIYKELPWYIPVLSAWGIVRSTGGTRGAYASVVPETGPITLHDAFDKLSDAHKALTIAHECEHVLRRHGLRQRGRGKDTSLWRIAIEIETEQFEKQVTKLYDNTYIEVYASVVELLYTKLNFKVAPNHSAETIYEELLKLPSNIQDALKASMKSCVLEAEGVPDSQVQQNDIKLENVIHESATILATVNAGEKSMGYNPSWATLHWEKRKPKVDFTRILRARIGAIVSGRDDYSYSKQSRRATGVGIIQPGVIAYTPKSAILVDVSGSMIGSDLNVAVSEAINAAQRMRIPIYISCGDVPDRWNPALKLTGGGGSDFKEPLTQLMDRYDIVLFLTDGYVTWPDAPRRKRSKLVYQPIGTEPSSPSWVKKLPLISDSK